MCLLVSMEDMGSGRGEGKNFHLAILRKWLSGVPPFPGLFTPYAKTHIFYGFNVKT